MSPKLLIVAVCCAAAVLAGCANNQIANSEQLSQQARAMASTATLTPKEALLLAIGQIAEAQAEQLRLYAPSHVESAEEALQAAQRLHDKGAPDTEVLTAAFKVGKLLESARQNRAIVETNLSQSLKHKAVLESLGTPKLLPDDFNQVVNRQTSLIRDIERGKLDKARSDELALLDLMNQVEVKTLKTVHLVPAEQMLDKAESEDADDYAEKTFDEAETTIRSAHAFIELKPRDREGVARVGVEALHAATHALHVGREAKKWVGLNEAAAEEKVLYVESLLSRINKGVGVENLNTLPLSQQSKAVAERIERGEAKINQNVVVYGQGQSEATGLTITPVTEGESEKPRDQ